MHTSVHDTGGHRSACGPDGHVAGDCEPTGAGRGTGAGTVLLDMLDQGPQLRDGFVSFRFRQILEQVRETRLPGPGLCAAYLFQHSLRAFGRCLFKIDGSLVKAPQYRLFPLTVSPQEPGHACFGPDPGIGSSSRHHRRSPRSSKPDQDFRQHPEPL